VPGRLLGDQSRRCCRVSRVKGSRRPVTASLESRAARSGRISACAVTRSAGRESNVFVTSEGNSGAHFVSKNRQSTAVGRQLSAAFANRCLPADNPVAPSRSHYSAGRRRPAAFGAPARAVRQTADGQFVSCADGIQPKSVPDGLGPDLRTGPNVIARSNFRPPLCYRHFYIIKRPTAGDEPRDRRRNGKCILRGVCS
jgi:hypothetical protein